MTTPNTPPASDGARLTDDATFVANVKRRLDEFGKADAYEREYTTYANRTPMLEDIQGLTRLVDAQATELAALRAENAALKAERDGLKIELALVPTGVNNWNGDAFRVDPQPPLYEMTVDEASNTTVTQVSEQPPASNGTTAGETIDRDHWRCIKCGKLEPASTSTFKHKCQRTVELSTATLATESATTETPSGAVLHVLNVDDKPVPPAEPFTAAQWSDYIYAKNIYEYQHSVQQPSEQPAPRPPSKAVKHHNTHVWPAKMLEPLRKMQAHGGLSVTYFNGEHQIHHKTAKMLVGLRLAYYSAQGDYVQITDAGLAALRNADEEARK